MAPVFDRLVGQDDVVAVLRAAAAGESMTHAWLFTGPPGSGRSVAALCLAAALQCTTPDDLGCGHCTACRTTMAGTHADVRRIVPEGLTIGVDAMRAVVQMASRRPGVGRWQVVIIEDADRLTENAAAALLKVVEEPPARSVFLLCAPTTDPEDVSVTLRSRCRHLALRTPRADAVAGVLREQDGLDAETAQWAASVSGGHVGRARRLARDPDARARRADVLALPLAATRRETAWPAADALVAGAEAEAKLASDARDERETDELRTALGAGGTGKGAMAALRGSAGVLGELEKAQKRRRTRTQRDSLDRALVDLAGFYRDAVLHACRATVAPTHPDKTTDSHALAEAGGAESMLRCLEAVLDCREAIDLNVKPRIAVDALVATLGATTPPPR